MTWAMPGKPLPRLGQIARGLPRPVSSRSRRVRMKPASLSYENIKREVMAAVDRLTAAQKAYIPASATLPEIIVAYALLQARFTFSAQSNTDGGRLRLGGAVVDFKVWLGSRVTIVRVMGDYWHSLPNRKLKDAVQFDRLHRYHYRVADLWEHDLYAAWANGSIVSFVRAAVLGAT